MSRSAAFVVGEFAVAISLLLVPLPIPAVLPLIVLASISLEVRGSSWAAVGLTGERAGSRLVLGVSIGVLVASAWHMLLGPSTSELLLLSGNVRALVLGLLLALAGGAATEMFFRGYLISSMHHQWGMAGERAGVVLGALLSVLALQPPSAIAAVGALVLALGYGMLYLAGARTLLLPIAVHVTIDCHGLISEFL